MVLHHIVNSTWVRKAGQMKNVFKYVHFSIELRLLEMGKLLDTPQKRRKCHKFSSFTYLCVRRRIKKFLVSSLRVFLATTAIEFTVFPSRYPRSVGLRMGQRALIHRHKPAGLSKHTGSIPMGTCRSQTGRVT